MHGVPCRAVGAVTARDSPLGHSRQSMQM